MQPLVHLQHVRGAARHIGMDGDREHPRNRSSRSDPVELVAPGVLDVARRDEAVAVRRRLDEHHRRKSSRCQGGGDLDQVGFSSALGMGRHPGGGMLGIIDLGPFIADRHIIGVMVVVHQRVVVLHALLLQQLIGLGAEFPPRRRIAARRLAGASLVISSTHLSKIASSCSGVMAIRVLVAVAVHCRSRGRHRPPPSFRPRSSRSSGRG